LEIKGLVRYGVTGFRSTQLRAVAELRAGASYRD
jgi:hypothetical protein